MSDKEQTMNQEQRANSITLAVSPSAEDLSELCSKAQRMEELLAAAGPPAPARGPKPGWGGGRPPTGKGGEIVKV